MTGVNDVHTADANVSLNDERLRALSPERRALLAQRLGGATQAIVAIDHHGAPQLTTVQRRLWLLERLDPSHAAAYNVPRVLRLQGALDLDAVAAAVTAVVEQHPVLRTRIDDVDGEPVARVAATRAIEVPLVSVAAPEGISVLDAAVQVAVHEVARPFVLDQDDLLRATVLRLTEDDHLLVLTTHHIAADEGSRAVLLRDLARAYAAATMPTVPASTAPVSSSASIPSPPLIQYADYAAWEHSNAAAADSHVAYWADSLAGAPDLIDLPTDRPRSAVRDHQGQRFVRELPAELAVGLQSLARRTGATTFAVILAGFAALLHRLSGQDDVVVGVPVSGRTMAEVAEVVGCFANTVALRLEVEEGETFTELVGRAREVTSAALAHHGAPFDRVVDALRPARDSSRTPVFQVCFNHVAGAADPPSFGSARADYVDVDPGVAKFDLTLVSRESDGGLRLLWEFTTDLFDTATVEAWHDHLVTMLSAAVADMSTPVTALPLLSTADLERLQATLAESAGASPDETVVEMFTRQAALTPEATAVVDDSTEMTYRELDAASSALAAQLAGRGVVTGSLVAVCVERSAGMIVALLAVLKAGGAYLPLDPAFPVDRLRFMLADSGCGVAVTQASLTPLVDTVDQVVLLDAPGEASPGLAPQRAAGLDDLAYVIYTSGSTGLPKGVLIEHRPLANFLRSMAAEPGCAEGDVLVAVTTLSFDIAALELFLPIVTGATVVVVGRDTATDPVALAAALERHGATIMQATPSTWRMLVDGSWSGRKTLRMLCGGEALPAALAAALLPLGCELWNMYGPTETTIWSTVDRVRAGEPIRLGFPVLNTDLLVVDRQLQPVPAGVAGELCIGGLGIARGYHNRPELTADRFVAHPLVDGARVYRTGDLVRARRDQTLEFLGRIDHQVKVRGFRIELGEVEIALAAHEAVRDVVVVVREDEPGDRRLAAYVVGDLDAESPGDLRRFVADRLPAYMVPSAVVVLDELPRTPNGKIDRKRLPEPERMRGVPIQRAAPRTELERVVARIWGDVLGLDDADIDIDEDFFEAGGDSLRAVRLVSRLHAVLPGGNVTLPEFLADPTVAGVARVAAGIGDDAFPSPVRQPASTYPLSSSQRRMWFLDKLEPGSPLYNVVIAFDVAGPFDVERFQRALGALTRRHEILRTALVDVGDEPMQQVADNVDVVVATFDVSAEADPAAAAAVIVNEAAAAPFDLGRPPLLRASYLRRDANGGVLLLVLHHAVVDGWSSDVLLDELVGHYAAGGDAGLPAPQLQYGDVAAWLGRLLDSDWAGKEMAHWRAALAGVPPVLQLPGDRPRPARQTYRGARTTRRLSAALMANVSACARTQGATPFMAMLAGFAALLGRYSGQDDVVIGTSTSGRERAGLEDVVGYLANTLPLRVDVSDDPSFRTLLSRARAATLSAYAHADMPFDRLVDELAPDRDTSRNPLFQVMLLMQPPRAATRQFGDAVLQPFVPDRGTSRFDLTLSCTESAEGLLVNVEYATDLFDAATVDDMLERLERLLAGAAHEPDLPASRVALLSPAEAQAALARSHGPALSAAPSTLHETFAARVAERPGAPAVSGGGRTLSYDELSRRANQLASALIEAGVVPGDLVALALPRDPDLLTAIIAVHRCGAAYLPLEPSYPSDRLEFMVTDAGVRLLVTTTGISAVVPPFDGERLLLDEPATLAGRPDTDPGVVVRPDALAYVIYTSGSTGKPKGVLVQHAGVVSLMAEMAQRPGLAAGDVLVGVTTPAFDLSVPDLFLPLLTGAHLVLADPLVAADPNALARLLDEVNADVMQATPSTWRMLLDDGWAGRPGMRVVCGGEGYTSALARPLTQRVGQLWNFYGPTEATVWCTSALLVDPADPLPLGGPLPGYFVYVADGAGAPVPHGVAGELVVGGIGLARGYHARPELTADRFITVEGRRTYRTGDLARTRRDGTLEFLGRIDHQVKLRGFRIELGEIESALAAHPDVRDVVVVVREDLPGDQRLVGYVVGAVDSAELRTFVGARLPSYMVPSVVMVLDDLPRTPNGKTDRKSLPVPDVAAASTVEFVGPRGPVEEAVAEMWCEVLRVERVGVLDDFFTLGGHSLRITQVLSRIRQAFGVDLPLREVYERPTVEAIAQAVTIRLLDDPELAELMAEIEGTDGIGA